VPSKKSKDIFMPARSAGNGEILSNVAGCPSEPAAYNMQFVRDRSFRPDEVIVKRNNRNFCSGQLVLSPSWGRGKFHFDFVPRYVFQPNGEAYAGTRW
jgi:hypothetical protein